MVVYLSLGTNLGDKETNLLDAIEEIQKRVGPVKAQSSFVKTPPWGFDSQNEFINAVVEVETLLDPFALLDTTQEIERLMGRGEKSKDGIYHDRLIDIDILVYGDSFINTPRLTIPHPLLSRRLFVLVPLAEIAPTLKCPRCDATVEKMKNRLTLDHRL